MRVLVAAGALIASGSIASAATWTNVGGCSVTDTDINADACWGLADSPANAQNVDVNNDDFVTGAVTESGLFGYDDWNTVDINGSFGGGDEGTINISDNLYQMVAVLLKSADTYAAYRYDGGLSGELDYFTANGNGLSNYVVVGRTPVIPLPAAGFLLLAGLGGLALVRRRK